MKTPIDLSNTVFSFPKFLGGFRDSLPTADIVVSDKSVAGSKSIRLPDFGNILVGSPTPENIESILQPGNEPLFKAPETWRMPQLLKALGAFDSASSAAKNGWNFSIPDGLTSHVIKINRVKGIITIFKLPSTTNV